MIRRVARKGVLRLVVVVASLLLVLAVVPGRAYARASTQTYSVSVERGYLALRTAPAYDEANEIGELYTGDVVRVKKSNKTDSTYWWVYSSKYGTCGYVNRKYLSSTTPSTYEKYKVKVAKGYLALRTAPAYDEANEIGELYTGDVVTVKDKSNGTYWWVYSSKYGRSGYVNKNYLVK